MSFAILGKVQAGHSSQLYAEGLQEYCNNVGHENYEQKSKPRRGTRRHICRVVSGVDVGNSNHEPRSNEFAIGNQYLQTSSREAAHPSLPARAVSVVRDPGPTSNVWLRWVVESRFFEGLQLSIRIGVRFAARLLQDAWHFRNTVVVDDSTNTFGQLGIIQPMISLCSWIGNTVQVLSSCQVRCKSRRVLVPAFMINRLVSPRWAIHAGGYRRQARRYLYLRQCCCVLAGKQTRSWAGHLI